MNGYLVVTNVPGYLPYSDPIECDTLEEAKEAMREEIEVDMEAFDMQDEEYDLDVSSDGMSAYLSSRSRYDLGRSYEIVEAR